MCVSVSVCTFQFCFCNALYCICNPNMYLALKQVIATPLVQIITFPIGYVLTHECWGLLFTHRILFHFNLFVTFESSYTRFISLHHDCPSGGTSLMLLSFSFVFLCFLFLCVCAYGCRQVGMHYLYLYLNIYIQNPGEKLMQSSHSSLSRRLFLTH